MTKKISRREVLTSLRRIMDASRRAIKEVIYTSDSALPKISGKIIKEVSSIEVDLERLKELGKKEVK